MKSLYLLAVLTLLSWSAPGQKVDLDRFHYDAAYLILPREYTEPSKRTFGVRVVGAPSLSAIVPEASVYDRIQIAGFERVESKPTVGVTVEFGNVRFEKSETRTRTEDKKDKNGKVTGQTTYYSIVVRYSISGNYKVVGPKEETVARRPPKKKEEEKPNRFLQGVSQPEAAPNTTTSGYFPYEVSYTTREYTNLGDARRYIDQNQQSIRNDLVIKYVDDAVATVNRDANQWYGYVPTQTREFLWILDSKSHPEYEIQQEAIKAVKTLTKGMSATAPLDNLYQNLQPLFTYFQELKTKYPGKDKREQKLRYSAFYNLAALNLLLDHPDEAIEEANGLVKNEYDTKDGERFIEEALALRKSLDKHKMQSRHMNQ